MKFGEKDLKKEIRETAGKGAKIGSKTIVSAIKLGVLALILCAAVLVSALFGSVRGILDQSPEPAELDISPKGLASNIYDADGNIIQTLIGSGANRSLVSYDQLPQDLIDAFVAIEDSRFWTHHGVDLKGIIRATGVAVATGFSRTEGASTITQQLIKNNVFEGGAERTTGARIVRKIQEQFLSLELEKNVSKQIILENYMNTINLGANCLGVEKAAERYFDKKVEDLTLSECAVIAAITQNPYGYNPIRFPSKNAERRDKVLRDMEAQGYITAEEKEAALADDVYTRIAKVNASRDNTETVYSYFVDRLIRDVLRDLQEAGYTKDQASAMLYSGGLQIYTTQDPKIQAIVDEEIAREENYATIDQKYSFTYTLIVKHMDKSSTTYDSSSIKSFSGRSYLEYNSREEIANVIAAFKEETLLTTDTISYEKLDVTLQPQVSVTVIDQTTGQVKAIAGGRGEKTASLSLNRATNTFRQPGSTFKVLASFAPALERGDTLATTFYDEPYSTMVNGTEWTPKNWYSRKKYAGYANIHQAIVYSMNIVAVRCLVEDVGDQNAFDFVEKFGINTLIPETKENAASGRHDVRATLALGGITQGVTNLQLTGAYAAIANGGEYIEPTLYTKILDNEGNVIIDNTPETHRVLKKTTAFLLTTAMADSLEESRLNGLFSSSSPEAKLETGLPAAGKSGTTTSYNDLWFVGYTPYYTMGIWSGFDDNAKFADNDNRDFHKTMWKTIMERITEEKPVTPFTIPEGIVSVRICNKSGKLATSACEHDWRSSIISDEYFEVGTEPTENCDLHQSYEVCAESGKLPGAFCTKTKWVSRILLPSETTGYTDDDNYATKPKDVCTTCVPAFDPLSPLLPDLPGGGTDDDDDDDSLSLFP